MPKPGGWADQHGREGHDRAEAPSTEWFDARLTDMPVRRQATARREIKGVPGPSVDPALDEDHQPGGGNWQEVTW